MGPLKVINRYLCTPDTLPAGRRRCGHSGSSGISAECGRSPSVGGKPWDPDHPPPCGTCSPPAESEFWLVPWSRPTPPSWWWHWMERLKDTEDDQAQRGGRPSEIRDGFVLVLLVSILHYLIRCFWVNKQHNNAFVTFDISIITTTVVNIAGLLMQNEDQPINFRDFPFLRTRKSKFLWQCQRVIITVCVCEKSSC